MRESNPDSSELGLTTHRIEALTDGVFAIAMTLLVLNLQLPAIQAALTKVELHNLLIQQMDKFWNYALSFILLAVFWIIHHQQFHSIRRTDRRHLWISIFILMFVALVPFSTSLADHYPADWMSEFFFGSNLFILGVLFNVNWRYATGKHRLVDRNLDPEHIALGKRRGMIIPIFSLLAMVIAFLNPGLCSYIYLFIPVSLSLRPFRTISKN